MVAIHLFLILARYSSEVKKIVPFLKNKLNDYLTFLP